MIAFILLLTSITFQVTTKVATGNEILDNSRADNHYEVGLKVNKRSLGSLAKNKQLPTVQQRSYFVPPMVSPYGNGRRSSFVDEFDAKEKRYLGTLARSGDLNFSKPQQKRASINPLETEDLLDELRVASKDDLPNPMVMKQEMIITLRPVILEYLNEFKKKYDSRKVDLFLENLANAIYDQNEEVSMESIRSLVQSDYFQPDYFQPEESVDSRKKQDIDKRNIQSLVRELNVSYSGTTHPELQARQVRKPPHLPRLYNRDQYEFIKRNLQSIIKNKLNKRWVGALAKNSDFPVRPAGKRDAAEKDSLLEYLSESGAGSNQYDEEDAAEYVKNMAKRHTMYDINEPDITFEYPSQAGEQADYSDYAEPDAAIPIGKRYLGALARSGWLPQGFALRPNSLTSEAFEKKRHIGALARHSWMPTISSGDSPSHYYRGGRAREFRPPFYRGPRAYSLKSEPHEERCQCKRSASDSSCASSSRWSDLRGSASGSSTTPRAVLLARQATGMLDKRLLLVPAVDHFLLRKLYPHLLRPQNV